MKFYCRLFNWTKCNFSILIHCGRLFQIFLSESFVKVESERLSFLRKNKSRLWSSDGTDLCELLLMPTWTRLKFKCAEKSTNERSERKTGSSVVLPSAEVDRDRCMGQKINDIIGISNITVHPHVFITITCNSSWLEIRSVLLPG